MTLYRETGGHDWCREHEGMHGSQCTFLREEVTIDYEAALRHLESDAGENVAIEWAMTVVDAALGVTDDREIKHHPLPG